MPGNKPLRVYIASKVGLMEPVVRELKAFCESIGMEFVFDWTEKPVRKPFEQYKESSHQAAENMIRTVMECDILVVLFAEGGIGFHIETGGALVAGIISSFVTGRQHKRIYVVGPGNDWSVFYFHNSVTRVEDVETLKLLLREI